MQQRLHVSGNSIAPFERCVFVNAPFDSAYLPLLHAILFTIHDCGFIARIAVEETGSNETRLDKIGRIILESRLSIHDVSRVETTDTSKLPRFNMPFECGLAMGAIRFGQTDQKRDFLLLVGEPFQDKRTLSDLAGKDSKAHQNEPQLAVNAVSAFLSAKKNTSDRNRGAEAIWKRYLLFKTQLPLLAVEIELAVSEIDSFEYLPHWINIVAQWQTR